jgi:hypothetical protein
MNLAKPRIDIGLSTNRLEPMLAFWQGEAGYLSTTCCRSAAARTSTATTCWAAY